MRSLHARFVHASLFDYAYLIRGTRNFLLYPLLDPWNIPQQFLVIVIYFYLKSSAHEWREESIKDTGYFWPSVTSLHYASLHYTSLHYCERRRSGAEMCQEHNLTLRTPVFLVKRSAQNLPLRLAFLILDSRSLTRSLADLPQQTSSSRKHTRLGAFSTWTLGRLDRRMVLWCDGYSCPVTNNSSP